MTYVVFARKWRPKKFSQVVGQDHTVRALTHALAHDRLHHAYLFCGTRGVGKTTLGRLLAKALNCESLEAGDPCGTCANCLDIDAGRFVDLIEVDAASRTRVEDTRDLLDNAQYAPSRGAYKVYLIDEVHMLSGHSFNALLKTLEEPPPHVRFVLATTDPQKIPVTVLSRCLQFNLKRLAVEQIETQLASVLQAEGITFETTALRKLAHAADGSMRDALSLLDQAVVHGQGAVREQAVSSMLGTAPRAAILQIIDGLLTHDARCVFAAIDELVSLTPDYGDVLGQLLQILHTVALTQVVPEAGARETDLERIARLAAMARPEDLQLFYQIALMGKRDLHLAPDPRTGFEMILLRMLVFKRSIDSGAITAPVDASTVVERPPSSIAGLRETRSTAAVPRAEAISAIGEWSTLVRRLNLTGLTSQLASHCVLIGIDETTCRLGLAAQFSQLRTARVMENLERALRHHFGNSLRLVIDIVDAVGGETPAAVEAREAATKAADALENLERDETVLAFREQFAAELVPGSVKPIE